MSQSTRAATTMPAGTSSSHQAATQAAEPVDFAREILPILSNKCFVCHGPDGEAKDELRLDSYEAAIEDHDDRWRIAWLRISSTHGWALPSDEPPYLSEALGAGTLRGGRPAL